MIAEPPTATCRLEDNRPYEGLMQAAQNGDGQACLQLLERIMPRLQMMVRGQRGFLDAVDIDDIARDTLDSVYAVRATYDPTRPFMSWLMAIARNRLADSGRRDARHNGNFMRKSTKGRSRASR